MPEEQVFDLIKDNKELSSLPQVLAEVIRITADENASAKDLANVIMKDPALTARMLRIVNSPFYGPAREISTVNQAVITLGIRAVKALALSTGLYKMYEGSTLVVDRMRFWRHSLETAIACREIAKLCAYRPEEEAFVAGLMHDLGVLTLEANYPDQFKRVWKLVESGENLVKLEEATWGTNHARVGKFLLDQWKLPKFIGEAIAAHHGQFTEDSLPTDRLGRIVSLGNMLSKFRTCQVPPLEKADLEKIDILAESLEIGPTVLAELQERILGLLIKESEFLEMDIGSITDLLESANSLLYKQYILVESVLRENRQMQAQIARDQMKKAALDSLKTITATLSHYINNASATILGRAQLVELAIAKKTIIDGENMAGNSMEIIIKSVETISLVLEELKKMSSFDTTQYHDETSILDIEDRLKAQIAEIEEERKAASEILR
ncbi:MAG: HDOD domain-containing protein [candidate division Zixibacteria bacterium]|nr:HDOD domain-containing protein [candidate division Zixibacteria bacterium]